jgi:hypothetical protein
MNGLISNIMDSHFGNGMNFDDDHIPAPETRAALHETQIMGPNREWYHVFSLDEDLETGRWIASNQSIEAIQ